MPPSAERKVNFVGKLLRNEVSMVKNIVGTGKKIRSKTAMQDRRLR